jgi:hypothetical protein
VEKKLNSSHSQLINWIRKFVSTKHLSNYLGWYKYKQFFKNEKEQIKKKHLLLHANLFYTDTKIENIKREYLNIS